MARRQKKGRGQYSNRSAIPGAELTENPTSTTLTSTPTPRIQQSRNTPRNNQAQPLMPESASDSTKAPNNRGPPSQSSSSKALINRHTPTPARYPSPPPTPPQASAPSKKPWELNLGYLVPQRRANRISFEWPSVWLSFPGRDPNLELEKELHAYKRLTLPLPLPSKDVAPERMVEVNKENEKIKSVYATAGQSALFDIRMKNRDIQYDAALIFSSRLPSLNGLDNSSWSRANVPVPLLESSAQGVSRPNFFNIMNMADIWPMILDHLKPSVRDLSAVAMTCKSAAVSMKTYFEVWDFHSGEFDVDKFMTKRDTTIEGIARGKYLQRRGVRSDTLLITGGHQPVTKTPYSDSFESMLKLFKAVRLAPFCFRDVSLHRIPFLDIRVLEVLIQGMPNLETLSISSCLLLDVTKLPSILKVILRNPRAQEDGDRPRKSYIKVDFSPFRFFGPLTLDRHGSFLITHHKPDFDIPKAVTALLYRCLPDAKRAGMDLLGDGSSFWHFLRQLPGPDPLWAVKVREAVLTQERFKNRPDIYQKTLDNLCAAVSGDCRAPERRPVRRVDRSGELEYGYWQTKRACPICETKLSRCLFVNSAPEKDNGGQRCWGCHAIGFVNSVDHSHFRYRKLAILDHLFKRFPVTAPPKESNNPESVTEGTNISTDHNTGPSASAGASPNAAADADPNANSEAGTTAKAVGKATPGEGNLGKTKAVGSDAKKTMGREFDDDGIFESSVFSVKSFSDPLGDEKRIFDRKYGLEKRRFSYNILNFMAQNLGVARRFAFMTDKAWNYYKGLKHGTSQGFYYEIDRGEHKTVAGAIYRWMRFRNPPTGPSEYLHGGPQYMHPCHESAQPKGFEHVAPKIPFVEFKGCWRYRYAALGVLRRLHLQWLETGKTQQTDFLEWAHAARNTDPLMDPLMERCEEAAMEEFKLQTAHDFKTHYLQFAYHEDAIFSLCAPNKVVYNLDLARMAVERENARWNLRKYAHGHRF
ncbi:hypothetical protein QBC37DRAFT_393846 [Rhypophila decipiens]|uniref:Uncharacterized protein n=1 Tax=Rhypophila decipiens TaxID=261697 RepID=A0AAN6YK98_9PEZI|nr:hypothetical protein QBC37DRAFT_393846 [Rhypophila decipiens]